MCRLKIHTFASECFDSDKILDEADFRNAVSTTDLDAVKITVFKHLVDALKCGSEDFCDIRRNKQIGILLELKLVNFF